MFFCFIFFISFISAHSFSAAFDAIIADFNHGNYARIREQLSLPSFDHDAYARLMLLASGGFESKRYMRPHLEGDMRALVRRVSQDESHGAHEAARIAHVLWNLYAQGAQRMSDGDWAGLIGRRGARCAIRELTEVSLHVTGTATPPTERSPLLVSDTAAAEHPPQRTSPTLSVDLDRHHHTAELVPPLGAEFVELSPEEIAAQLESARHFPVRDLFDGHPSELNGVIELLHLVERNNNSHALYVLGMFCSMPTLTLENEALKREVRKWGASHIFAAAELKHSDAVAWITSTLHLNDEDHPGWANNCRLWCCAMPQDTESRYGCGGDRTGRWWQCGLGLCGFSTRWSLGELCLSLRSISRTALENTAILVGMVLLILQQIDNSGLANIFPDDHRASTVTGLTGLFLSLGGFTSAQLPKNPRVF